jgi:hypothetical protein
LIVVSTGLVLTPGAPLGLLTNAVQALAGILLPSATVFLLLLSNDKAVLGPWVNTRWLNLFSGGVIAVLLMLSIILTASVMFPDAASEKVILAILGGGSILGVLVALGVLLTAGTDGPTANTAAENRVRRGNWRMPPLGELPPPRLSMAVKTWMVVLRAYLVLAAGLVLIRIVTLVAS